MRVWSFATLNSLASALYFRTGNDDAGRCCDICRLTLLSCESLECSPLFPAFDACEGASGRVKAGRYNSMKGLPDGSG